MMSESSVAAFSSIVLSHGTSVVAESDEEPLSVHSSASAPDSHRLPLFSPLLTGHKTYLISGKRKSHTGRLLPV